jgi:AcrR family transcriptional regulator
MTELRAGTTQQTKTRRPRPTTSARRDELVRIAQDLIAREGLEGFRTRQVADKAGIDTGTLHYHFPSKEGLIQAVVEGLVSDFRVNRAPQVTEPATVLEELRREIMDAALRVRLAPNQLRVLFELRVRSFRDAAIAAMLKAIDRSWEAHLVGLVVSGQEQGALRRDVRAETVARVIRTELEGMALRSLADPTRVDEIASALNMQLATWLAEPRT